jgi:MFS superfamily sulfate permease-like transporter
MSDIGFFVGALVLVPLAMAFAFGSWLAGLYMLIFVTIVLIGVMFT